jgi:hypothetical protein
LKMERAEGLIPKRILVEMSIGLEKPCVPLG